MHLPAFIYRCRLILSLDGLRDWPSDLNLPHPCATDTPLHTPKHTHALVPRGWWSLFRLKNKDTHYSSISPLIPDSGEGGGAFIIYHSCSSKYLDIFSPSFANHVTYTQLYTHGVLYFIMWQYEKNGLIVELFTCNSIKRSLHFSRAYLSHYAPPNILGDV